MAWGPRSASWSLQFQDSLGLPEETGKGIQSIQSPVLIPPQQSDHWHPLVMDLPDPLWGIVEKTGHHGQGSVTAAGCNGAPVAKESGLVLRIHFAGTSEGLAGLFLDDSFLEKCRHCIYVEVLDMCCLAQCLNKSVYTQVQVLLSLGSFMGTISLWFFPNFFPQPMTNLYRKGIKRKKTPKFFTPMDSLVTAGSFTPTQLLCIRTSR